MLPVLFGQQSAALLHQSEKAEPERGGETPGVYICCADAPTWPSLLWTALLKDVGGGGGGCCGVVWCGVE